MKQLEDQTKKMGPLNRTLREIVQLDKQRQSLTAAGVVCIQQARDLKRQRSALVRTLQSAKRS